MLTSRRSSLSAPRTTSSKRGNRAHQQKDRSSGSSTSRISSGGRGCHHVRGGERPLVAAGAAIARAVGIGNQQQNRADTCWYLEPKWLRFFRVLFVFSVMLHVSNVIVNRFRVLFDFCFFCAFFYSTCSQLAVYPSNSIGSLLPLPPLSFQFCFVTSLPCSGLPSR